MQNNEIIRKRHKPKAWHRADTQEVPMVMITGADGEKIHLLPVVQAIPGSGRCPRIGNGNPLQYSCLENSMDRGVWWAIVHRVTEESNTTEQLNNKQ